MTYRAVWRHKTNKFLFAERPYYWCDTIIVIDETHTRQVIHSGKYTSFDFSNWIQCSHTELKKVKTRFRDMYNDA